MHNLDLPLQIELRTTTSISTWEKRESDYESPRAKNNVLQYVNQIRSTDIT